MFIARRVEPLRSALLVAAWKMLVKTMLNLLRIQYQASFPAGLSGDVYQLYRTNDRAAFEFQGHHHAGSHQAISLSLGWRPMQYRLAISYYMCAVSEYRFFTYCWELNTVSPGFSIVTTPQKEMQRLKQCNAIK